MLILSSQPTHLAYMGYYDWWWFLSKNNAGKSSSALTNVWSHPHVTVTTLNLLLACQAESMSGSMVVQRSGCWQNLSHGLIFIVKYPFGILSEPSLYYVLAEKKWPHVSHYKDTRIHSYSSLCSSLLLPQSMTSAPVAKICVMRMPSAPTPSEDTCVPASRATWAMAPSAGVSSCTGTALWAPKHRRKHSITSDFSSFSAL